MHFANCAALTAVLFTTLIQNLRLCSSAEAGIMEKSYMIVCKNPLLHNIITLLLIKNWVFVRN